MTSILQSHQNNGIYKYIYTCSSEHGVWSWDSETLTKANGFLRQLCSFEFCITMRILSSLRSLTVNLQKRANDILAAYEHISDIMLELELLKTNCEEEFHSWFDEIKTFADNLSIPVCTPGLLRDKCIEQMFQLMFLRYIIDEIS